MPHCIALPLRCNFAGWAGALLEPTFVRFCAEAGIFSHLLIFSSFFPLPEEWGTGGAGIVVRHAMAVHLSLCPCSGASLAWLGGIWACVYDIPPIGSGHFALLALLVMVLFKIYELPVYWLT